MKRLIGYTHGRDDPAGRFRIAQYEQALRNAGWELSLRPRHPSRPWTSPYRNAPVRWAHQRWGMWRRRIRRLLDIEAAASYDAAFVNRDLLEGRKFFEQRLLQRNPRVIFDFDDAIFLEDHGGMGSKAEHVEWMCRHAAWVTPGNEALADFARRFTDRVTVLPTTVDVNRYRLRAGPASDRLRIGWLGSDQSIRETLFPHAPLLSALQAEIGFEFVVVSKPRPELPESGLRWRYEEWSPEVETRIAELFDIGIMPLTDTPYQRAKCGCKLLQYMAAGMPWIASPVGLNSSLSGGGRRGLLAATDGEWRQAIEALGHDCSLRRRLGAAGRSYVERHYSIERWLPELLEILLKVSGQNR